MGSLGAFFARAFSLTATGAEGVNAIVSYLPLLALSALAATPLGSSCWKKVAQKSWAGYAAIAGAALVVLLCAAALASSSYNPFIYFRF